MDQEEFNKRVKEAYTEFEATIARLFPEGCKWMDCAYCNVADNDPAMCREISRNSHKYK